MIRYILRKLIPAASLCLALSACSGQNYPAAVDGSAGPEVEWSVRKWKDFIAGAEGRTIEVKSEMTVGGSPEAETWHIYVSEDPVDGYLTYRLIEPSFQMFHEISIEKHSNNHSP